VAGSSITAAGEELAAGRDGHQARGAHRTALVEIGLGPPLDPEQGGALAPGAAPGLADLHADLGIGVVIAIDQPVDAERVQGRRLHHRIAMRPCGIAG